MTFKLKFQGFFFEREDVALPGFSKFFKKSSDEEREHAQLFMGYQNKRGGKIVLQDVAKPNKNEWGSALEAVEAALELEKTVNQVRKFLLPPVLEHILLLLHFFNAAIVFQFPSITDLLLLLEKFAIYC